MVRLPTCLFQKRSVFVIVERYVQCQSYLKRQDDFRTAFTKSQLPDKSTVFRLVSRSCEIVLLRAETFWSPCGVKMT
jgi:hypothetical protein